MNRAAYKNTDGETVSRVHVVQGEHALSDNPSEVLLTVLGSCVAACMWDPAAGVGGMNHFLLPGVDAQGGTKGLEGMRYGVNAMELLINNLLKRGASRNRLQAKLFGGASVVRGLTDVGGQNAAFAERYLSEEGITYMGGSLGGKMARKVQFWPASGRARQMFLPAEEVVELERPLARPARPAPVDDGNVELF